MTTCSELLCLGVPCVFVFVCVCVDSVSVCVCVCVCLLVAVERAALNAAACTSCRGGCDFRGGGPHGRKRRHILIINVSFL